jgi:hypothetical protein
MTIFYKIYQDGREVKAGQGSYVEGKGYKAEPTGTKFKYYDSDPAKNIPMTVSLNPLASTALDLGKQYVIEVTAYESNDTVVTNTVAGSMKKTINTPQIFSTPQANLRITQGQKNLQIKVLMADVDRIIINDKYSVELYGSDGALVKSIDVTMGQSSSNQLIEDVVEFTGLEENTQYVVKVVADLDRNNDGAKEEPQYMYVENTATVSQAEAKVESYVNIAGNPVFALRDCVNFENVSKIRYTIYSEDVSITYTSETVPVGEWKTTDGTSYSYEVTQWQPPYATTYRYAIQYVAENDELLGTTIGYFTKS